jgi:hypothetical protein
MCSAREKIPVEGFYEGTGERALEGLNLVPSRVTMRLVKSNLSLSEIVIRVRCRSAYSAYYY